MDNFVVTLQWVCAGSARVVPGSPENVPGIGFKPGGNRIPNAEYGDVMSEEESYDSTDIKPPTISKCHTVEGRYVDRKEATYSMNLVSDSGPGTVNPPLSEGQGPISAIGSSKGQATRVDTDAGSGSEWGVASSFRTTTFRVWCLLIASS